MADVSEFGINNLGWLLIALLTMVVIWCIVSLTATLYGWLDTRGGRRWAEYLGKQQSSDSEKQSSRNKDNDR